MNPLSVESQFQGGIGFGLTQLMAKGGSGLFWVDKLGLDKITIFPHHSGWWTLPFDGGRMQRVNVYQFYQFSTAIHPLSELQEGTKLESVLYELFTARTWLRLFLDGKMVPMTVCKPTALRLLNAINDLWPTGKDKGVPIEKQFEFSEAYAITSAIREFEIVLGAELQATDTYFVSQKGIYATGDLIERADIALDEEVRNTILPDAIKDFRQAGRCLAFELPTASAFHIMRATETTLRQWHKSILNPVSDKPDWATCVNELQSSGADKNTLSILDQIRFLHRNPIMHPEIFLTVSEGLQLFDIAKSAISAMAEEIKRAKSSS